MGNNIVLKDSGKYSIKEIRELAKEFFSMWKYGDLLDPYDDGCVDIEDVEKTLNMFLKWLGVRAPIANKLGWVHLLKKDVRKRAVNEKETKSFLKKARKDPKILEKIWY